VPGLFTVKMRIGFDSTENYERVLGLINKHRLICSVSTAAP